VDETAFIKENQMINVTKTYLPDRERFKKYADRIFDSGWLTNNGQTVRELEGRLSEYLGVENILLVTNGTIALQVAYRTLGIKGGAVTTPFTFVATASSLVWEGINPVFCDIDTGTLNITPESINKALTRKCSAIVPVHVFGNACLVDEIGELATGKNLKLVYDAAHAFGIKYKGKSLLSYGDASAISFHSTKIFHTIEGGAIVFRNKEDIERARLMINFGISGYDKVSDIGINGKMNEFQAAMGLCVLEDMPSILKNRELVYNNYFEAFSGHDELRLQSRNPDADNNWAYFPVIFNTNVIRERVFSKLYENGIFARRYFSPSLEILPYLRKKKSMKVSESTASRILCLPIYESLSNDDQGRIIDIVISAIAGQ